MSYAVQKCRWTILPAAAKSSAWGKKLIKSSDIQSLWNVLLSILYHPNLILDSESLIFMIAHFVLPFKASPWAKLILSFSHQPVPSACCITANLMAWKLCQYTAAHYFSTGQWCLQFREDSAVYAQSPHKAQVLNTNNEIFRFYRWDKGHSEVFTQFFFLVESLSAEPVTSLTVTFLNFSIQKQMNRLITVTFQWKHTDVHVFGDADSVISAVTSIGLV